MKDDFTKINKKDTHCNNKIVFNKKNTYLVNK